MCMQSDSGPSRASPKAYTGKPRIVVVGTGWSSISFLKSLHRNARQVLAYAKTVQNNFAEKFISNADACTRRLVEENPTISILTFLALGIKAASNHTSKGLSLNTSVSCTELQIQDHEDNIFMIPLRLEKCNINIPDIQELIANPLKPSFMQ